MARRKESLVQQPWDILKRHSKRNQSNSYTKNLPTPPVVTTKEVMAHRSQSFAYGSKKPNGNKSINKPIIYAALLSKIALELRHCITLSDHIKDDIEYKNTFTGKDLIDKISAIIQTNDRKLALRIGKALSFQRFFHDVNYETQLIDSSIYIYEFTNHTTFYTLQQQNTSDYWSESESQSENNIELPHNPAYLPNGVFTELTHCYVPTCFDIKPCYSPICPKRLSQLRRIESNESFSNLIMPNKVTIGKSNSQHTTLHNDLWADNVDKVLYDSLTKMERKRQENIYELIYTEKDYVQSLEYMQTMWIYPLSDRPIIPISRRESFIKKVFRNVQDIYKVNIRLLRALEMRQGQHPIIHQIGDILLNFVIDFEPYIMYGSKQYEAKFALENERYINSNFDAFVENTERHPSSLKLELNGYLTKPTTRLGRYNLLLNEIMKHTSPDHPDIANLSQAIVIIKRFLSRVNIEAGNAKNRFDLERIHYNLSYKYKTDEVNLDLLDKNRQIIKQGTLKKTPQNDSVEYQVILFDHYLVIAKLKIINGTERYVIQKRPIPLELLSVHLPDLSSINTKRSSANVLPYINNTVNAAAAPPAMHVRASTDLGSYVQQTKLTHYPITFQHLGRKASTQYTLFASSQATRKPWLEKIRAQQEEKNKKSPIFELVSSVREHQFFVTNRINHFITFNGGQQYLLAADDGVYVGHHDYKNADTTAHQILSLEKVTQIQTIESTGTLLVLADRTLWEYPLDVVNGKPGKQPQGSFVQAHVPFFHVGQCLKKIMVCVPRISTLKSVITLYEAIKKTEPLLPKRSSGMLDRLLAVRTQPAVELHLQKLKDTYVPAEAYAIDVTPTKMLVTASTGMVIIDINSNQTQQLLNPSDKHLSFILEREKDATTSLNLRQPIKRISVFRTPRNHYFLCYDEYAFYIDGKGNRLFNNFLIEWEGTPESYAFCYPFVMAFDSSFIEIRNVITGAIEQIIRGKNIKCVNNGHQTELPLVIGTMTDPVKDMFQFIFHIRLVSDQLLEQTLISTEPATYTL